MFLPLLQVSATHEIASRKNAFRRRWSARTSMIICADRAETRLASSALRERLRKRARGNDAQLSWRQRRGGGSQGEGVSRYNSSVAQAIVIASKGCQRSSLAHRFRS